MQVVEIIVSGMKEKFRPYVPTSEYGKVLLRCALIGYYCCNSPSSTEGEVRGCQGPSARAGTEPHSEVDVRLCQLSSSTIRQTFGILSYS